ncbi:unnamed protein product, partial [Ectocarpus fasciculatus]
GRKRAAAVTPPHQAHLCGWGGPSRRRTSSRPKNGWASTWGSKGCATGWTRRRRRSRRRVTTH